jgi:hypothetical protein
VHQVTKSTISRHYLPSYRYSVYWYTGLAEPDIHVPACGELSSSRDHLLFHLIKLVAITKHGESRTPLIIVYQLTDVMIFPVNHKPHPFTYILYKVRARKPRTVGPRC